MRNIDIQIHISNLCGYYITIWYNDKIYTTDSEISKLLGMTIEAYQKLVKSEFNCLIEGNEVSFELYEETIKFSMWLNDNIDAFVVMKTLVPSITIGK